MSAGTVMSPAGEILTVYDALHRAIDQALPLVEPIDDGAEARLVFGRALTKALHDNGLLIAPRAAPQSSESVKLFVYSLALERQHAAERLALDARTHQLAADHAGQLIGLARAILLGDKAAGVPTLLEDLHAGISSLAGRAPPADRVRAWEAAKRLGQLSAILLEVPVADLPGGDLDFCSDGPDAPPPAAPNLDGAA